MNTSCGDTVKCRLDAGKSPIFRSQSPCTYIYVQESQRGLGLRTYIYTPKIPVSNTHNLISCRKLCRLLLHLSSAKFLEFLHPVDDSNPLLPHTGNLVWLSCGLQRHPQSSGSEVWNAFKRCFLAVFQPPWKPDCYFYNS